MLKMNGLLVSAILLALQSAMVMAGNSNFTATCNGAVLSSGSLGHYNFLNASCGVGTSSSTVKQVDHTSMIDLNLCLGISQSTGQLEWGVYGKFSQYCADCSLVEPVILTCTCAPIATGQKTNTTINLNEGIGNVNGSLACLGGIGS